MILLPKFSIEALLEAKSVQQTVPSRLPSSPAIQGRALGQFIAPRNVRRSLRDLRTDPVLVESLATTNMTPEDLTPHVLRRTAATLVARREGDLRKAKELLGHADERTTKNSYAGAAYKVVGSAALLDDIIG